ncbi:hypothetical protein A4G99_09775 [Haladaptatus sp. R4]|uniref:hypothetical protein n=1 Tax=Haladaptatus sp. R4 TaxID=1679489 RepID=UPI0007B4C9EC|nr:hypothetical protein [Haladaptatus sp. R4]KZN24934.1 hypothetical protein A4G99_09775 [Haladaptatus sp. R4]
MASNHPCRGAIVVFDRLNPFGSKKDSTGGTDFKRGHRIEIRCPETMTPIATEHTDPDDWDSNVPEGEGVATYDCPACGGQHRYLWGPPVPLCLDDDNDDDELVLFEGE